MHESDQTHVSAADHCRVLGVAPDAGDREIRAAYLAKVRAYPPDAAPEEFERIRDAYKALSDPRLRLERTLLAADPGLPLAKLFEGRASGRRFAGPEAWLAVLKERRV